jgi:hypothetical protein
MYFSVGVCLGCYHAHHEDGACWSLVLMKVFSY